MANTSNVEGVSSFIESVSGLNVGASLTLVTSIVNIPCVVAPEASETVKVTVAVPTKSVAGVYTS